MNKRGTPINSMAVLPKGLLAGGSADRAITIWDLKVKRGIKSLRGHRDSIVALQVLQNGNLVSYSIDDTLKVWNPYVSASNLLLTITGHGNKKFTMPFGLLSNDFVVACSRDADNKQDSILRVWNSTDGKLVKSYPTGLKRVFRMLVLSNDEIAIGTEDGAIKVLNLGDESKTRINERAHEFEITCLVQLPNENLVSAGRDEEMASPVHSINVGNWADCSLMQHIITDHSAAIFSLDIAANQDVIASGSYDQTIKIWPIIIKDAEAM